MGLAESRFPALPRWAPDPSHPAMRVNLDACIQCNLCVRACREVQVNDVIGMAHRNAAAKVVFDFDDPMGASTCVACGECVQACPTGALMPAVYLDEHQVRSVWPDRSVDSLCPYCGVGCQVTYQVKDDRIVYAEGRDGPANHNRLCVKGRFGFDYASHPHRLTKPLIRRADIPKHAEDQVDPANPWTHFREASWEEALDLAGAGLRRLRDTQGPKSLAGFGSAKGSNEEAYLFQKLVRTGFGSNNVDHCTRLCHASSVAALMEGIELGRGDGALRRCPGCRGDFRDRRQSDREPPGGRYLHQECGEAARGQAGGNRPTPPVALASCGRSLGLPPGQRRGAAECAAAHHHRGRALRPAICRCPYRRLCRSARTHPRLRAGADGGGLRHPGRDAARAWRGFMPAHVPPSSSGAWASASMCTAPTMPAA
jgi:NAD-dependent dihydropyrimidine dehydrogenase PreA subunit